MTRDELADRIKYTLGLQDDTTFSETDFVNDLIFEGITDIVARCRPYTRVINMDTTADTQTHDLSTAAVISLLDVADEHGFLDRYTREDIEHIQAQGGRGYCYEEPLLWISPIGAKTLRVFGVFRPQKMTAGDQTPSDPLYGGLAGGVPPDDPHLLLLEGRGVHAARGLGERREVARPVRGPGWHWR